MGEERAADPGDGEPRELLPPVAAVSVAGVGTTSRWAGTLRCRGAQPAPRIRVPRLRLVCRGAGGRGGCGVGRWAAQSAGRGCGPNTPGRGENAGRLKACFSKFRKLNVDSANKFWKY